MVLPDRWQHACKFIQLAICSWLETFIPPSQCQCLLKNSSTVLYPREYSSLTRVSDRSARADMNPWTWSAKV